MLPDDNTSMTRPGDNGELPPSFRDEGVAARLVEKTLWGKAPACPHCGSGQVSMRGDEKSRYCGSCRKDFSLRTGTVFERSHLPIHTWLHAMHLAAASGGTISSAQLGRELGIRQASAWSLLRRLRSPEGKATEKLLAGILPAGGTGSAAATKRKDVPMAMTRQELAGKIYNGIKDGTLLVGDKLPPEREIAAIHRTSRGAVREAIIVLETLGFIEVRGKEGVFVRSLSEDESNQGLEGYMAWPTEMLPHTFQVRLVMESEAAGLAALQRTDEDIQRMGYCLQGFARILRERPDDWNNQGSHLNELFHKLVVEATHNPVLLRIHEGLQRVINRAYTTFGVQAMITPLDQWDERIIKGHRVIVDAIEARDEKAARDIMRTHLAITFTKHDAFYRERIQGMLHTVAG